MDVVMAKKMIPGWISMVVTAIVFVVGYTLVTGNPPGVAGGMTWPGVVSIIVIWMVLDSGLNAIFGNKNE